MRRRYAHLAGDLSGWPKGMVPTPAVMRALDQFSSELVNGDEGGTWAPESPIVIGPYRADGFSGANITIDSGSELTGDVVTVKGNAEGTEIVARPGLVLSGTANPGFQSTRSRTIVVGFTNFVENDSSISTNVARVVVDEATLGAKFISTMSNTRIVSVPFPLKAQHRGATISQVDLRFIVPGVHTALPSQPIRVRVAKITGSTVAALHDNSGGYDANGNLTDPAGSASAFMNNGQVRTLSYVPNQNHTAIDPDSDWFIIQCRPYSGASEPQEGLGLVFVSATVSLTSIASLRE
jgi:hypothetical protein